MEFGMCLGWHPQSRYGHRAIGFLTIQAGDAWHDTTWIWGRAFSFHFCPGYNDVAFVKHLLQHVANRFCVDLSALDFASACDCMWGWAKACEFLGFSHIWRSQHPCSSFSMKDGWYGIIWCSMVPCPSAMPFEHWPKSSNFLVVKWL